MEQQWTVSEVADLAKVTVRTLHHYDEIGLLPPSERSEAGYRLYSEADLERLQQILLYRELDLALETIARVLDEPAVDRMTALQSQRELLVEKLRKTEAVIRAVDRTLQSMKGEKAMNTQDMFEGFEDLVQAPEEVRAHHASHAEEAHERWGETEAYTESLRRVKNYAKGDWDELEKAGEENESRMASPMKSGEDPDGGAAMDVAEAMRQHISRWFYPCSREMHAKLADMYEADGRFKAHYEARAEGLARYVATAIRANASSADGEGEERS